MNDAAVAFLPTSGGFELKSLPSCRLSNVWRSARHMLFMWREDAAREDVRSNYASGLHNLHACAHVPAHDINPIINKLWEPFQISGGRRSADVWVTRTVLGPVLQQSRASC